MKKNMITILLLIIAVVAVVGIKNGKKEKEEASGCESGMCTMPVSQEKTVAASTEKTAESAPLPKLLDLGADKCVPCKMMAPILDEMKETFAGQLDVEFIDVWENQSAGQQYGIRLIPTQIFFDAEGKELFRHEGFYAREDMLAKWQELGVELTKPASED